MITGSYSLDNCEFCAAVTYLVLTPRSPPLQRVVELLARHEIGCWNCEDQGDRHGELDIFLQNVVAGESVRRKVWCGHRKQCSDVEA